MSTKEAVVTKFGGTSVTKVEDYQNTASVIGLHENEGMGVVSVVSARKSTTDMLHKAADNAYRGSGDYIGILNTIGEEHMKVVRELPTALDRSRAQTVVENEIWDIQSKLTDRNLSGASLDRIFSAGERMNVPNVVAFLRDQGMNAVSLPSEQVIAMQGKFGDARVDIEKTKERIRESLLGELSRGRIVVLGGYYGSHSEDMGQIMTFGRGGSDMSATAVAEALNSFVRVRDIYLYKADVPGVMSADPRRVPNAHINRHMMYSEIKVLSGIGGTVIHPYAVFPAEEIGANLHVKSTLDPHDPGTLIDGEFDEDAPVKAVSLLTDLPWIRIAGPGMDEAGITAKISRTLSQEGKDIRVLLQPLSEQTTDILLSSNGDPEGLEEELQNALQDLVDSNKIEDISVNSVAAVGIVGHSVNRPAVKMNIYAGLTGTPEFPIDPFPNIEISGDREVTLFFEDQSDKNLNNVLNSVHQTVFESK